MAKWVVGSEESTVVQAEGGLPGRGSLPGRGAPAVDAQHEPAGEWHAISTESGRPACGSRRFMVTFPDRPWASGEPAARCQYCLEEVALDNPDAR